MVFFLFATHKRLQKHGSAPRQFEKTLRSSAPKSLIFVHIWCIEIFTPQYVVVFFDRGSFSVQARIYREVAVKSSEASGKSLPKNRYRMQKFGTQRA